MKLFANIGVSTDLGSSLYREADSYIEVATECFGKDEVGVRKYASLAMNHIRRFIEDTRRWESYKSNKRAQSKHHQFHFFVSRAR